MRVFLFDKHTEINHFFDESDINIPFLGANLFQFNIANYIRWSEVLSQTINIYLPISWQNYLPNPDLFHYYDVLDVEKILLERATEQNELIIVNTLQNIILKSLTHQEINFIFETPNKVYTQNDLLIFSYNKNTPIEPNKDTFKALDNFYQITLNNFLMVNENMVSAVLSKSSLIQQPTLKTYGEPIILSEHIFHSTVCGPALVDKDSDVQNSYIGAGSIVIKSTLRDTKVFNSFIYDSSLDKSVLENSIVSKSIVKGVKSKNTKLTSGSEIEYDTER